MSLLEKLKQFRVNHKIAAAIIEGSAAFTAANTAQLALDQLLGTQTITEARADYFDGYRGPNLLQFDQRLQFGKNGVNYTLLPKAFIDLQENAGIFAVAPFNYSPEQLPTAGAGIGGYFSTDHLGLLGIVPVVYSAEGKATIINPTLFATIVLQHFQLNPRISYTVKIADGTESAAQHNIDFGCTVGYQIDNIILGFDIATAFDAKNPESKQLSENLLYQGILRIDLDNKHKNWLETYIEKDAIGIGLRNNFDWK
ncbi:hypothetical protein HZA96_00160 [Candidatus Woesearchaeota archaeon]|nr:hypothetical protein [Candidatus Woesearchaeota archaeon]